MGNVFAASPLQSSSEAMRNPAKKVSPDGTGEDLSSGLLADIGSSVSRNPGPMEELHKKCKGVFPTAFEGARFVVNKGLSNHFQISHTINMSSVTPSGYRFGATYVGTNMVGPGEAYPVLLGDIDPSGNVNANILHQFHPRIKSKLVAQIEDSHCVASQVSSDYKGDNYTASITLGNIDLVNSSGIGILHYLRSVTPTVDAGIELAYQYGPQVPGGGITALSFAGRYTSPNSYVVSGTVSSMGAHVCYYHKAKENLEVGVEVETNLRMGESVASFGYQFDLPKADLVFRGLLPKTLIQLSFIALLKITSSKGSVDSNWQVSAVLEKKLQPMPFTFLLSGHISHAKNPNYKFGCGLLIG
ncbi:mitochondrial import receptor subunit TOM40 1-like protein [Dinothrombium tinctorium]|uniref:Mitochondrial import receptor subunit TOM40 1-like protein n=1 Tax=Dinothrombium tinctorium TaxID=1965070 RepID=A0A3S3QCB2_9ACAR|nr:mitochondrial import receptor subunit TOM40 1-like protein [Dinothrombium tinctorium]RWS17582.1 mitochondrial import receptor subunit TOM40 1-like protein [Dinothrombium tinctorium]RWS17655.1 mitochondrial import receptor subunit TOM40 1-like protein [Dinothrombium tinctorium]